MAKATAICHCEICGNDFEKTTIKSNRRDADAWEEWAKTNITVCPSCYGKQKRQEEADAGYIAEIRLGNPYAEKEEIWIVLFGDLFPIKDTLKSAGARWSEDYPDGKSSLFYMMQSRRPSKRWAFRVENLDQIQEKTAVLEELGFEIRLPTDHAMTEYRLVRNDVEKMRAEEAEKLKAELEKIGPKPKYPEDVATLISGRWNGRIYGKSGAYRIYVDNIEKPLTNEQKKALEETREAREAWEAKKKKIESDN